MKKSISSAAIIISLVAMPVVALAQDASVDTGATADVTATISAPGVKAHAGVKAAANAQVMATREADAKNRANQEITRRVNNLTQMSTRIAGATHISSDAKASISSSIQAQINQLQALDTQIQNDSGTTTLRTDIESITQSYRIYALVLPQLSIMAAADRVIDVADAMNTLAGKLDTRISSATSTSADVNAALTDLKAKVADAQSVSTAAVSAVVNLKPDNGDKTVMASNTTTLKSSKAQIQTAQQDLVAARKDVTTIFKALGIKASASASASTTASTTMQ